MIKINFALYHATISRRNFRSKKKLIIGIGAVVIVVIVIVVILVVTLGNNSDEESKFVSNSLLGRYSQVGVNYDHSMIIKGHWFQLKWILKLVRCYSQAAVTTNGQECAEIGSHILRRNGSAVDAAIAALLCEGVACLHRCGGDILIIHLFFDFVLSFWSYWFLKYFRIFPSFRSMGIGGGFFMTIWDASTNTAQFLDARETAPASATEDMFEGNSTSSMYGKEKNWAYPRFWDLYICFWFSNRTALNN